jgi:Domain of unknown function (DUF4281)
MNIDSLPNSLYYVVMGLSTIGWLALIVFPRSRWANFWLAGLVLPLALCLIYMYLVPTFWFRDPPASLLQFLSLEGISNMLRNRGMLLVAWTDLVIMDLVGAAWMTRKAAQIRMPYIYLLPCLLVGFVFIGYGFMLFAIIAAIGGGWSRIAEFEAQPPTNTEPAAARPDVAAEPA